MSKRKKYIRVYINGRKLYGYKNLAKVQKTKEDIINGSDWKS